MCVCRQLWSSRASVALFLEADQLHGAKLGRLSQTLYSLFSSSGYTGYYTPCAQASTIKPPRLREGRADGSGQPPATMLERTSTAPLHYGLALALAAATFVLHAIAFNRYGYFQDELYFVACAHHLALGYPDVQPAIAFIAWLAQPFHFALWSLRMLPAISASATVYLSCRISAYLGGRTFAQLLTGVCVALMPLLLIFDGVLSTTSFEPLLWTIVAYYMLRLLRERNPRFAVSIGVLIGVALWFKFTIVLLAIGIVVAAACFPAARSLLLNRNTLAGVIAALVIAAPTLWWQASHGWPIFGVAHGDSASRHALRNAVQLEFGGMWTNAVALFAENAVLCNIVALPLVILGIVHLARSRDFRVFAAAYGIVVLLALITISKSYYVASIGIILLAAGAVAFERSAATAFWRRAALAAIVSVNAFLLPFFLPVLPLRTFVAYEGALHLIRPGEATIIQPLYADELQWNDAVAGVARAYRELSPAQRRDIRLFSNSYAYTAALDFYGPRYGLPSAISPDNAYFYWFKPSNATTLLVVGATRVENVRMLFRDVNLVTIVPLPQRALIEGPLPIYLARSPRTPLSEAWPSLQHFGV